MLVPGQGKRGNGWRKRAGIRLNRLSIAKIAAIGKERGRFL
jgi:hypothetical protein